MATQPPKRPKPRSLSERRREQRRQNREQSTGQQQKPTVKEELKQLIDSERYKRKVQRHLMVEALKDGLGVGNMDTWEREVELGYALSTPLRPKTLDRPYGKPLEKRPKLKKVSRKKPVPVTTPKKR